MVKVVVGVGGVLVVVVVDVFCPFSSLVSNIKPESFCSRC